MNFIDFARAHGVEINQAKFFASDKIRRCGSVLHPKSTNGAYLWDGERGFVFAWDQDAKTHWFEDANAKPWTDAEKRAMAAKRQSMAADQERKHHNAALQADVMLRSTVPAHHDYLMRKGLGDSYGMVLPDHALFVPMRNLSTNELQGAQIIRWLSEERKWEKKMVLGMRAKGAVLRIGPKDSPEIVLCEGYATGLSIDLAARQARLRMSVMVCFSDSNMVHVAGLMKESKLRRFVFADNDKSEAGQRAAIETNLPYCMSPVLGEDANDLHVRAGLMAVTKMLMDLRLGASP